MTVQLIGRTQVTLKPGDIYVLQTGPSGSDTLTLAQAHLGTNALSTPLANPENTETETPSTPQSRSVGMASTQLVPGTVTTATIILKSGSQAPTTPISQPFSPQTSQAQAPTMGESTGSQGGSSQASKPGTPFLSGATNRPGTYTQLQNAAEAATRAVSDDATSKTSARSGERRPISTPAVSSNANKNLGGSSSTQTVASDQVQRAPDAQTNQPPDPKTQPAAEPTKFSGISPLPAENSPNQPSQSPLTAQPYKPSQAQISQMTNSNGQPIQTDTIGLSTKAEATPSNLPYAPAQTNNRAEPQASSNTSGQSRTTETKANPMKLSANAPIVGPTMIERLEIRVLSVWHPGEPPPSNAVSDGQGIVFAGTVVGTSTSGQTVLTTPQGLMTIAGVVNLPAGTRLTLERTDQPTQAPNQQSSPPPAPLTHLAQHWETLNQTLRLLEMTSPTVVNQLGQDHVARPGPQLTAAILLFIAAVRFGDLRGWLGDDAAQAIQRLRIPIAGTLVEEFTTMQRASEPGDSGWRGFFIPLLDQGQLNQIRLFLNQERYKEGQDGEDNVTQTHFLVDLSLRAIGDLQIDGMVKRESVDLLVRSREALSDTIRRNIREIFTTTLARTGINGQLAFRVQKRFPDLPFEALEGYQDSFTSGINV